MAPHSRAGDVDMRAGVLVVGSLWWDTQQHRIQWRRDRLLTDDSIRVRVPLRYGRRSRSRGNTFTMVMSEGREDGQALIVPCRNELATFDGLRSEAEQLWAAEHCAAAPGSI